MKELLEQAQAEFRTSARHFEGMYERLYKVAQGASPESQRTILDEWENRLKRYDYKNTSKLWEAVRSNANGSPNPVRQCAQDWLAVLHSWGFRRENTPHDILASEAALGKFDLLNGEYGVDVHEGDKLLVVQPQWRLGDSEIPLERGRAQRGPLPERFHALPDEVFPLPILSPVEGHSCPPVAPEFVEQLTSSWKGKSTGEIAAKTIGTVAGFGMVIDGGRRLLKRSEKTTGGTEKHSSEKSTSWTERVAGGCEVLLGAAVSVFSATHGGGKGR